MAWTLDSFHTRQTEGPTIFIHATCNGAVVFSETGYDERSGYSGQPLTPSHPGACEADSRPVFTPPSAPNFY